MPAPFNEQGHLSLPKGGVCEKQLGEGAGEATEDQGIGLLKRFPPALGCFPPHSVLYRGDSQAPLCADPHLGSLERATSKAGGERVSVFRLETGLLGLIRAD